jgi:hypothetical protein
MKHATAAALQHLSELLDGIRIKAGVREKGFGIFYRKSKSFLHFHEDPAGLFADLNGGTNFDRYPVNTEQERQTLLSAIDRALDSGDQKAAAKQAATRIGASRYGGSVRPSGRELAGSHRSRPRPG